MSGLTLSIVLVPFEHFAGDSVDTVVRTLF